MDTIFVHFVSQCLSLKTLIEHTTVLAQTTSEPHGVHAHQAKAVRLSYVDSCDP